MRIVRPTILAASSMLFGQAMGGLEAFEAFFAEADCYNGPVLAVRGMLARARADNRT